MSDLLLRFAIGGVIVSAFAFLGDLFKPKSFAGLFGSAPSVALASLGIAIAEYGKGYASLEARSMIAGAIAMLVYAGSLAWVMMRRHWSAPRAALGLSPVWFAIALGLWLLLYR